MPDEHTYIPSICEHCHHEFLARTDGTRRFCSRGCATQHRRSRIGKECAVCGKPFIVSHNREETAKYCSPECLFESRRGKPGIRRSEGRFIRSDGYVMIRDPHAAPGNDDYILEHRWIAEQMLGRSLTSEEVVHHRNQQRSDNRESNLQILSPAEHSRLHRKVEGWARDYACCTVCGTTDRPHVAHGLCTRCKQRIGKSPDNYRDHGRWAPGRDCCIVCSTNEREHCALGMCKPCYERQKARPDRIRKPTT